MPNQNQEAERRALLAARIECDVLSVVATLGGATGSEVAARLPQWSRPQVQRAIARQNGLGLRREKGKGYLLIEVPRPRESIVRCAPMSCYEHDKGRLPQALKQLELRLFYE